MNKFAFYNFDFGILEIGYNDNAIVTLGCVDEIEENNEHSTLSDLAFEQINEYLLGVRTTFDFPIELIGTEFQKKVWNALCMIPYGETRTYKEIAIAIGNPKACRAVGMANHNNPIMIAVPCHRVIGANGSLVGYAGGLDLKKTLLDIEQKNK